MNIIATALQIVSRANTCIKKTVKSYFPQFGLIFNFGLFDKRKEVSELCCYFFLFLYWGWFFPLYCLMIAL